LKDYCEKVSPRNWAYKETVRNCIQHGIDLYEDGSKLVKDPERQLEVFQVATHILRCAVEMMKDNDLYKVMLCTAWGKLGE
jgi:hypothetical protein